MFCGFRRVSESHTDRCPYSIVEKYPGFAQSETLCYPIAVCRSLAALLRESNEIYPPARRSMIGLDVGWLQRV